MKLLTRRHLPKVTVSALIFAAIFLLVSFTGLIRPAFNAAAQEPPVFTRIPLGITNPHFSSTSGSGALLDATGWTGSALGSTRGDNVIHGVATLTADGFIPNNREIRLAGYPEGTFPRSPFGEAAGTTLGDRFKDSDKNALVINTGLSEGAFGYTSSALTLEPDRFFRISVWVRTGDFTRGGAFVTLNGLDRRLVFEHINTTASNNPQTFSWQEFAFYVASPSHKSSTVTLGLQVGDFTEENLDTRTERSFVPSIGWALFDTVTAEQISPIDFRDALAMTTSTNPARPPLNFHASDQNGFSIRNEDRIVFDANELSPNLFEDYGWDFFPYSDWTFPGRENQNWTRTGATSAMASYTLEDGRNTPSVVPSRVLIISANSTVHAGVNSLPITIGRNTFYRLGIWVNAQDIEDGSGASVVLRANRTNEGDHGVFDRYAVVHPQTNLTGNTFDGATFGWQEVVFYIQGSSMRTIDDLRIELALGQEGSQSQGVAMFTGLRLQRIDPREFDAASAGGTHVTLSEIAPTTIANGHFNEVGPWNPNDLPTVRTLDGVTHNVRYPLPVSGWVQGDASSSHTAGFPVQTVETDDFVGGIVHMDVFGSSDAYNIRLGTAASPTMGISNGPNVLMMFSPVDTAVFYRSPALSLSADSHNRITVTMRTLGIRGYGANLVLKRGNSIIATIEQIDTNDDWREFSFYVSADTVAQGEIFVEIWLGLEDRHNLGTKLSRGHVFVDSIEMEASDFSEFQTRRRDFVARLTPPRHFAVAEFGNENFIGFDRFSNEFIRTPYNWSLQTTAPNVVSYGIFNANFVSADTPLFAGPTPFEHIAGGQRISDEPYVMMLRNAGRAHSTLSSFDNFSLESHSFYRLVVSMKVFLSGANDNTIGARLELTGTPFSFENIQPLNLTMMPTIGGNRVFLNEYGNQINPQEYQEYVFYISTGDSAHSVFVDIGLGGRLPVEQAAGVIYINSISLHEISGIDFDVIEEYDEDDELFPFHRRVSLGQFDGDTGDDEATGDGFVWQWWLLPSIVFSALMLIALVLIVGRKAFAKVPARASTPKKVTYDRQKTLKRIHGANTGEDVVIESDAGDNFDMFDDSIKAKDEKTSKMPKQPKTVFDEFDDEPLLDDKPEADSHAETTTTEDETVAVEEPKEKITYSDEFED